MKVLLFAAKGFETIEFSVFIDVLGWAKEDCNCDITVDTVGFTKIVVSTFGVPVMVDKTIDEINLEDYDALAIPGGFDTYGFFEEVYKEEFLNLIREFHKEGKPIGTICVAALALGKSGILKNVKATTYHLDNGRRQGQLKDFGAVVINEPIVVSNNIITSYCPETAIGVAFALLEKLVGIEKTKEVKALMGY